MAAADRAHARAQSLDVLPASTVKFGDGKLEVPRPETCLVSVEAVGRHAKTPDLQLAPMNLYLSAPAATALTGGCNCRAGGAICRTLCRHDPVAGADKPPVAGRRPDPQALDGTGLHRADGR